MTKKVSNKIVKSSKPRSPRQTYGLTGAFLIISLALVFDSIISQSFTLLISSCLVILVSALVLNIKKAAKLLKGSKKNLNTYRERLFYNTTRLVIVGVVLTWLAAAMPVTSPVVILLYIFVGVVLIAAIISSLWLLFTKETLTKKLIVVLYILVIPILVAGAVFAIILSNLNFTF